MGLQTQLCSYEADMATKHEQEKRACFDEVRTLQAKLDQQELRIQAAEEEATRQRKKRKRVEEKWTKFDLQRSKA